MLTALQFPYDALQNVGSLSQTVLHKGVIIDPAGSQRDNYVRLGLGEVENEAPYICPVISLLYGVVNPSNLGPDIGHFSPLLYPFQHSAAPKKIPTPYTNPL